MTDDEILDACECADYLKVSRKVVLNMARTKRLPAVKVGHEWRFSKNAVTRTIACEEIPCYESDTTPTTLTFIDPTENDYEKLLGLK